MFYGPKEADGPWVAKQSGIDARRLKAPVSFRRIKNDSSHRAPGPKPVKLQIAEKKLFTNAAKKTALLDALAKKNVSCYNTELTPPRRVEFGNEEVHQLQDRHWHSLVMFRKTESGVWSVLRSI